MKAKVSNINPKIIELRNDNRDTLIIHIESIEHYQSKTSYNSKTIKVYNLVDELGTQTIDNSTSKIIGVGNIKVDWLNTIEINYRTDKTFQFFIDIKDYPIKNFNITDEKERLIMQIEKKVNLDFWNSNYIFSNHPSKSIDSTLLAILCINAIVQYKYIASIHSA